MKKLIMLIMIVTGMNMMADDGFEVNQQEPAAQQIVQCVDWCAEKNYRVDFNKLCSEIVSIGEELKRIDKLTENDAVDLSMDDQNLTVKAEVLALIYLVATNTVDRNNDFGVWYGKDMCFGEGYNLIYTEAKLNLNSNADIIQIFGKKDVIGFYNLLSAEDFIEIRTGRGAMAVNFVIREFLDTMVVYGE